MSKIHLQPLIKTVLNNRKILLSAFCMCLSSYVLSQKDSTNAIQKMQGVWLLIDKPENTNKTASVTITRGSKTLNFEYALSGSEDYLGEYFIGFQDSNFNDVDSINVESLKKTGNYYTVVKSSAVRKDGWVIKPDFLTPEIMQIDEQTMWINFGNISMYQKINNVPRIALKLLYARGKKSGRDYIKDYLNAEVREVGISKCIIYAQPGETAIASLSKNELVYVREKKDTWCKIEFESNGNLEQGWVRRSDIDFR